MPGPAAAVIGAFSAAVSAANVGMSGLKAVKELSDQFGSIQDLVSVTCFGSPRANRQQLYHLAASIAFGMVHRLAANLSDLAPPPGAIAINYDATSNVLTFTLRYSTSLAWALASTQAAGRPDADQLYDLLPVLSGPREEVVGGKWDFTGTGVGYGFSLLPGLPVPVLEDHYTGRVQITKHDVSRVPDPYAPAGSGEEGPTLNPRPAADSRSRGTWCQLVYSALSLPGTTFDQLYPKPPASNDKYRGE
ncbi:hypothetical protein GobsT_40910 [Gemmata obscuriglobus]|nr:hypothetical protein GobsT_40910 [Gemmata obscuriglobus]VTS08263.1 unnamed protein product [Gemmata obscuriglobus UQM 2246]